MDIVRSRSGDTRLREIRKFKPWTKGLYVSSLDMIIFEIKNISTAVIWLYQHMIIAYKLCERNASRFKWDKIHLAKNLSEEIDGGLGILRNYLSNNSCTIKKTIQWIYANTKHWESTECIKDDFINKAKQSTTSIDKNRYVEASGSNKYVLYFRNAFVEVYYEATIYQNKNFDPVLVKKNNETFEFFIAGVQKMTSYFNNISEQS